MELQAKMAAGLACGFWQGYELELSDFRHEDLAGILRLLDRWQQEAMGRMFDELLICRTMATESRVSVQSRHQAPLYRQGRRRAVVASRTPGVMWS